MYEMKIPGGSSADVKLKVAESQSISIQTDDENIDHEKIEGLETGSFKLMEGSYIITVSNRS